MHQSIRFLKTPEGVTLAWAEAGSGPTLVKAANWLSHLEYEWDSPVWRHWIHFLAENYRFIRYDERGCGMSDWDVADVSHKRWVDDFDAVVKATKPEKPFVLLGISQGGVAAITYAAHNPDHVSHLVLYGVYARGPAVRQDSDEEKRRRAVIELTRIGWGQDNPVYRQLFTSRFIPGASPEQIGWFNELCKRTATPEIAARIMEARMHVVVFDGLPEVKVPTLVLHARGDNAVPLSEGRYVASYIPGAEFVLLDSNNHILLETEPAWQRFKDEMLAFTGRPAGGALAEDPIFAKLSPREREILAKISAGRTNIEIGRELFISEKTVRNHVTKIFEKLDVRSRAQAIVLAKDKGLSV